MLEKGGWKGVGGAFPRPPLALHISSMFPCVSHVLVDQESSKNQHEWNTQLLFESTTQSQALPSGTLNALSFSYDCMNSTKNMYEEIKTASHRCVS